MPGNKKTKKHRKSVPAFGSFTKGDKLLSFSVRKALLAFKEGKGTPVDWFTICHRLSICLSLIEEHYIEQSLKEMNASMTVHLVVFARHQEGKPLEMSPQEFADIEAGIDAADTVEKQTTIQQQLRVYSKLQKELGLL